MAIALVAGQTASATNAGAGTTVVVTLPNNPTTGNLVVVGFVGTPATSNTYTCADSNSNTYAATSKTPFKPTNALNCGIFYLQNTPANATKTITVTTAGGSIGASGFCAWAIEVSGADTTSAFENDATQHQTSTGTAINLPTYTTLNNGDLLFSSCLAGQTISVAVSPWTGIGTVQNGNFAEYFIQSTAGAQAVAYTQSPTGVWDAIEAAFKATAGIVVVPPSPLVIFTDSEIYQVQSRTLIY